MCEGEVQHRKSQMKSRMPKATLSYPLSTRKSLDCAGIFVALTILYLAPCPDVNGLIATTEIATAQTAAASKLARLEVHPERVLEGDPVSIIIAGLRPGILATVHVQSVGLDDSGKQQLYHSEATFMAEANGTVNLATAAPTSGYYHSADPRGLFWSQKLLANDPTGQAAIAALPLGDPASINPGEEILTLQVSGKVEDRKILTLSSHDPGVVREDVRSAGLVGAFYYEKNTKNRPVVVALGGSEGGLDLADWIGPKLASRGFTVFGLNYFSPPRSRAAGVPTALEHIPVESLENVRSWLKARPEANVNRLGVVGYSKGAEFTLVLASTYDWIKAAVAYSPSDVVWQGIRYASGPAASSWSRGGRDLPFIPSTGAREEILKARQSGANVYLARIAKANLEAASPEALEAATIPIERSHAALLLMGGGDDEFWDSGASVERAAARLKRARYPHAYQILLYPGAGHAFVGTGWRPTTSDNTDPVQDGGTPEADAHAQADSWIKMLDFLKHTLQSK
jgi:dienelactone hydrolase